MKLRHKEVKSNLLLGHIAKEPSRDSNPDLPDSRVQVFEHYLSLRTKQHPPSERIEQPRLVWLNV